MWLFLARLVILVAATYFLNKKKGDVTKVEAGQRDPDSVSRATETTPIPIIVGTVKTVGNITWDGDEDNKPIVKKVKSGGFFGLFQNTEKVNVGFEYYMGMQIMLGMASSESPIKLMKWQIDGYTLYDNTSGPDGSFSASVNNKNFMGEYENGPGGYQGNFTFYAGESNQARDPYLLSVLGDNIPKYNRRCHFIWKKGYYGNNETPNTWSFVLKRILHNSWSNPGKDEIDGSVNPACYIYYLLTDKECGLGKSDSEINLVNFLEVHEKLYDEGIGISDIITTDIDVETKINQIFDIIGGQFNTNSEKISIKLTRNDYDVDDLEVISGRKVVNITNDTIGSLSTIVNEVKVKYIDINDDFKEKYAISQNQGVIFERARVETTILDYVGVTSAHVAQMIADRELIPLTAPLRKCRMSIAYSDRVLSTGDVVVINYPDEDYDNTIMRITDVNYGNINSSTIVLSLIQDQFGYNLQIYNPVPSNSYTPPDYTAVAADLKFIEAPFYFNNVDTNSKVLTFASRPNQYHLNYDLYTKFGTDGYIYQSTSQAFTPVGNVNSAITTLDNTITLTNDIGMGVVESQTSDNMKFGANTAIIIESDIVEFINFQNISLTGSVYTLSNVNRALFDTKPLNFTNDAKIYFISYGYALNDAETYTFGTPVRLKAITKTVRRSIDINDAPENFFIFNQRRKQLPILMSNLEINGQRYEETITIGSEDLELTWSNRDRINATIQYYDDDVTTNLNTNVFRIRIYDNTTSALLKDFTTSDLNYTFTDEQSMNSGSYFTSLRLFMQTEGDSLASLFNYDIIINR